MKTKKPISLKNSFLMMFLGINLVIVISFLLYHQVVMAYAKKNATENLTFIIEQLYENIDRYFTSLERDSTRLAADSTIQKFLLEYSTNRYSLGVDTAVSVNTILSGSTSTNGCILYDSSGSFYRYNIGFRNDDCASLYSEFGTDKRLTISAVIQVDGTSYYMIKQSIYTLTGPRTILAGNAMLFGNLNVLNNMLKQYNSFSGLTISLWNKDELVLSNISSKGAIPQKKATPGALFVSKTFPSNRFELVVSLAQDAVFPYESIFLTAVVIMLASTLVFFQFFRISVNRIIMNPITQLVANMQQLGNKTLKDRLPPTKNTIINMLVSDINALLDRVEDFSRRAFKSQEAMYDLELKKREMELHLLRKQINAHFTFNTLNTIKALAQDTGEGNIVRITDNLATLIRYSQGQEEYINLFNELQIVEKYVQIMNVRFSNNFKVDYEVEDTLATYVILQQLLQPIVENAFVHGFKDKSEDCLVEIVAIEKPDHMQISIRDNGAGIQTDILAKIKTSLDAQEHSYATEGIALININRRIKLYHGDRYGLTIESKEGEVTTVTITLPLIRDKSIPYT